MAASGDPPVRTSPWLGGARLRILAAFVVLLAASEAVSLVADRRVFSAQVRERVSAGLTQEVEEFRRLVANGRNPQTGRPFDGDLQAIFDTFLVRNVPGEGERVFTFLEGRPYRAGLGARRRGDIVRAVRPFGRASDVRRGQFETTMGPVRYLAVPVRVSGGAQGTFVVTADLGAELDEAESVTNVTTAVDLFVLLLASLLAYAVAGRVLRPLRELGDTAQQITESDLTRRIAVRGNDEIAELGRTFNAMLARIEDAFASQRAFVSDAGHELRTPITIIRGHLDLLGDDPDERRETMAIVDDELGRMSRLVEDLLTLAKSERPDFLLAQDVDLDVLTEELFAKARTLADRDWRLEGVGAGVIVADPQRLTQAVMNLAANAAQHTVAGDTIVLGSALEADHARFWVRDTGPGVPEAEQARIFERFARGRGSSRSEGAGLGLAITRAVAEAHGGQVRLRSSPGDGAEFSVTVAVEATTAEHSVVDPPAPRGSAPGGPTAPDGRPRAPASTTAPRTRGPHPPSPDDPTQEIPR